MLSYIKIGSTIIIVKFNYKSTGSPSLPQIGQIDNESNNCLNTTLLSTYSDRTSCTKETSYSTYRLHLNALISSLDRDQLTANTYVTIYIYIYKTLLRSIEFQEKKKRKTTCHNNRSPIGIFVQIPATRNYYIYIYKISQPSAFISFIHTTSNSSERSHVNSFAFASRFVPIEAVRGAERVTNRPSSSFRHFRAFSFREQSGFKKKKKKEKMKKVLLSNSRARLRELRHPSVHKFARSGNSRVAACCQLARHARRSSNERESKK